MCIHLNFLIVSSVQVFQIILHLQVGVPVMLLRNIDQSSGLCNGTKLIITRLRGKVFILRMSPTPSDARISFKFQRRQFSIIVFFAITINKSHYVMWYYIWKNFFFTHGQLYVALSRVTTRKGLKILCYDEDGEMTNETTNVVYKEVFSNLEDRCF